MCVHVEGGLYTLEEAAGGQQGRGTAQKGQGPRLLDLIPNQNPDKVPHCSANKGPRQHPPSGSCHSPLCPCPKANMKAQGGLSEKGGGAGCSPHCPLSCISEWPPLPVGPWAGFLGPSRPSSEILLT